MFVALVQKLHKSCTLDATDFRFVSDRAYDTKWRILVENQFDPKLDLQRNDDGLLELMQRNPGLRDAIRRYFRARNEDCHDVK